MKIFIWNELNEKERIKLLERPSSTLSIELREKTQKIIDQVKANGDEAIRQLTAEFDQIALDQLAVTADEFEQVNSQIDSKSLSAIEFIYQQIYKFHVAQVPKNNTVETSSGVYCERQTRPIERVGLYVPGGTAPLISTLLMLGVPAQIANCPVRVICTPPNRQGKIDSRLLLAAKLCGIQNIYKVGGAQAIAAMAYGTKSVPKVDKIFGPGNAWVTQAKVLVSQDANGANIDMPAGPSEVLVIADDSANPDFVAADLLSQAEHGIDSQVILITFSQRFASLVQSAIVEQTAYLSRRKIIEQSLKNSRIIIVDNAEQSISISNCYAPEHLILQLNNPEQYISSIQNAGAVFLGPWSAETMGDYVTGSNHVLPTSGYARNCSGLSISDFMKFITFQKVTSQGIEKIGPFAEHIAEMEGLTAHRNAVSLRLKELRSVGNSTMLESNSNE